MTKANKVWSIAVMAAITLATVAADVYPFTQRTENSPPVGGFVMAQALFFQLPAWICALACVELTIREVDAGRPWWVAGGKLLVALSALAFLAMFMASAAICGSRTRISPGACPALDALTYWPKASGSPHSLNE